MKTTISILVFCLTTIFVHAQLSDVYLHRSYSKSENTFIEMTMSNMPSKEYKGTLTLKLEAYRGEDKSGEKIADVLFTRTFTAIKEKKQNESYTLDFRYTWSSDATIEPKSGTNLADLVSYIVIYGDVYFNEYELILNADNVDIEFKALDIEIERKEEVRNDLNDAQKMINDEGSMFYKWFLDNEGDAGVAYQIYLRVKERDSEESRGVFDAFGRLSVFKMKKGKLGKIVGNYYFDYKVNEIKFHNKEKEIVKIDVTINNFDEEKKYKKKEDDELFMNISNAIKNNTWWVLKKEYMALKDGDKAIKLLRVEE